MTRNMKRQNRRFRNIVKTLTPALQEECRLCHEWHGGCCTPCFCDFDPYQAERLARVRSGKTEFRR